MKHAHPLITTLVAAWLFSGAVNASIIYQIERTIGIGSVTGTITTDGTLGTLWTENCGPPECGPGNNIIDLDLRLDDGTGIYNLTGLNTAIWTVGNDPRIGSSNFRATPTSLLYDFDANGFALFQAHELGDGTPSWHLNSRNDYPSTTEERSETVYAGPAMSDVQDDEAYRDIFEARSQVEHWTGEQVIGTVISEVPEPGSLAMIALGLVGLGFTRKMRCCSRR